MLKEINVKLKNKLKSLTKNMDDSINSNSNLINQVSYEVEEISDTTGANNTTTTTTTIKFKIFSQNNIVVALLFLINLVNFMDRFTIAGLINYYFLANI
jgi:hypothetical protein